MKAAAAGSKADVVARGADGVLRVGAAAQVPGSALVVYYALPQDTVTAQTYRDIATSLAPMAVILVAAFGLAAWAAELLVLRRTRAVSAAAERIAAGDLAARSGVRASDDVGRLGAAFDAMADAVAEREHRLERANRALRIVNAANRELLRSHDEASLLAAMCRHVVQEGGYLAAWVGRLVAGESRPAVDYVAGAGIDDAMRALLQPGEGHHTDPGDGAASEAIMKNRPVIEQDLQAATLPGPWRDLAARRGLAAAAALPIRIGPEVWGAMTMYAGTPHAFGHAEMALLGEATNDLAIGLATLRAQTRERAARQANKMKSEFLASMSHELRTPLNAVIGFSEVLRDGLVDDVTPRQREYLQDILSSGTHLLDLVNDILDLSKVEAGSMALELEAMPVAATLQASLTIVREKALAQGLTLELHVADGTGVLFANVRRVKQIVYNLLSNAVKFTPRGGRVTLAARRVAHSTISVASPPEGAAEFLEIAVTDTGIGIAAEHQGRLFAPFVQIDSSLGRQYEGTGLGLALVKRLVELHGGAVGLESGAGRGSTFTVWLPYRPAKEAEVAAPRATPGPDPAGATVLVVENEPSAFEQMRSALAGEGFDVVHAASDAEARARLRERRPDLIVLDIMLPPAPAAGQAAQDDGRGLFEWLKHEAQYAAIPVVVVSMVGGKHPDAALGASAVLRKPLQRDDLVRALAGLGFTATEARGQRVLIVDDDAAAGDALTTLLEAQGLKVERAYNGREGIERAVAQPPALIVLDFVMPEVSGLGVVTALRSDARTALTPIIIVSAKDIDAAERSALAGRVQAVLNKGNFSTAAFVAEARHALGHGGRQTWQTS